MFTPFGIQAVDARLKLAELILQVPIGVPEAVQTLRQATRSLERQRADQNAQAGENPRKAQQRFHLIEPLATVSRKRS